MVNVENFVKRLEIIFDYYGLNAAAFADKIGVQRSSLSHLLSGRNKPSLDFILKITAVFTEVDLYWIVNGKGVFPKEEVPIQNTNSAPIENSNQESKTNIEPNLFSEKNLGQKNLIFENKTANTPFSASLSTNEKIDRIVVFYANGSFKTYSPE